MQTGKHFRLPNRKRKLGQTVEEIHAFLIWTSAERLTAATPGELGLQCEHAPLQQPQRILTKLWTGLPQPHLLQIPGRSDRCRLRTETKIRGSALDATVAKCWNDQQEQNEWRGADHPLRPEVTCTLHKGFKHREI